MASEKDTEFRDLLSKLEILGDGVVDKAVKTQQEDESRGLSLPLAAVLVRRGFLAYSLAERLLAHQAGLKIVCQECHTESSASDLDPRIPFHCLSCGQEVEPDEPPEEFSLAQTVPGMMTSDGGDDEIIGRVLGGCKVERKIGAGGMGAVYVADQEYLRRKVAIKILPRDHVRQPGFVKRFLRESRSAAQVIHPNVVQVLDAGQDGDLYYIVMEFVEGKSLYEVLREEGRIRPYRAVEYALEVTRGLAAASKHGIIHRDVKPDNIRLSHEGVAKVADFGLAKGLDSTTDITRPGAVIGTPLYMSPEQARGEMVDFRSDIYSLGATLYHLISGRPPFRATTTEGILQKQREEEPGPLDDPKLGCPGSIAALIQKMMAKDADDRFPSYELLIKAMEGIVSRRPSSRETVRLGPPPRKGRRGYAFGAAAIVLVGGILAAWHLFGGDRETRPPPQPPPVIPERPPPPGKASVLIEAGDLDGARVYIDDRLKGETPYLLEGMEPGIYRLRIRAKGHREVEREIELGSGENQPIRIDLERLMASIRITTDPSGARVRIDGEEAGPTPVDRDDLPSGQHAFTAEMDGYDPASWEMDLTGEEGRVEKAISLRRVSPVYQILEGLGEVASLLDAGCPLRADRALRGLVAGNEEIRGQLFQNERILLKDLEARCYREAPRVGLVLRFGSDGSTLAGTHPPIPSHPRNAADLGVTKRQYRVESTVTPEADPLHVFLIRFSLARRQVERLLDGPGSRDVRVDGPYEVEMIVLVATAAEVSPDDVDSRMQRALREAPRSPLEAGPAILEALDRWLGALEHDHIILAAWFDERHP